MISTLPFVFLALMSMVAARPNLQRRGLPGAVYYCDRQDFLGTECTWLAPNDICHETQPGFIKSFGPDPDGTCILYKDYSCTTGQEVRTLHFPGLGGGIPEFAAFKCFSGKQARRDGTAEMAVKVLDPLDDRLAGGVGSAERANHLEEIKRMEEDGFSEGLIGLKKGVYY